MPFDPNFLAALERLAHLAKRLARVKPRRRRRLARRTAGSGEVRDRRPYAPGDEVRAIDWSAYARLGRLFSKLFETEEPRDLVLLVDVSASMGRPRRKLAWTIQAAAASAYLALARHDRVGVTAFADRAVAELPPRSGRGGGARILGFLEALEASGPSDPGPPFAAVVARHRKRALALIFTDGLWPGDPAAPLATLEAAGLEAVLVHAIDPHDRDPPLEGALEIASAETGARLALAADERFRAAYREAFEVHAAAIARACARAGAAYVAGPTEEPVEAAILELLRAGGLGG